METRLPSASTFSQLDSRPYLIDLLPMAAYAVRAPEGVKEIRTTSLASSAAR